MSSRYLRDPTGQFPARIFHDPADLESRAEKQITSFLQDYAGGVEFPISTDLLTQLLERDAADLDLFANLGSPGEEVHGVTQFVRGEKPRVRVAAVLSEDPSRENRLRTTLTHEYAHVWLHDPLYQLKEANLELFEAAAERGEVECLRDGMLDSPVWYEWQAGFMSGALLMPESALVRCVLGFRERSGFEGDFVAGGAEAEDLCAHVSGSFQVSREAAEVRLKKREVIIKPGGTLSLFA